MKMTNQEAIKRLLFMKNGYQKLIDENVDNGMIVGNNITGTWRSRTSFIDVYKQHVEACDMAISALEKQIPKKPLFREKGIKGEPVVPCGNCGAETYDIYDYCPWCGQKQDNK